jgi:hypothetical protein
MLGAFFSATFLSENLQQSKLNYQANSLCHGLNSFAHNKQLDGLTKHHDCQGSLPCSKPS